MMGRLMEELKKIRKEALRTIKEILEEMDREGEMPTDVFQATIYDDYHDTYVTVTVTPVLDGGRVVFETEDGTDIEPDRLFTDTIVMIAEELQKGKRR